MKSDKIKIPASNLYLAEEKIAKINKRAAKLGLAPLVLHVGEDIHEERDRVIYTYNEIVVEGEYPVINGWRIIGSIDHDAEDNHLISTFGEFDVKRYREMKPVCEHCNHHKITVKSFLVENVESKNIKAVGRGCLKNYIDKDPKAMLNYLEWFAFFIDELEGDGNDGSGWGNAAPTYDIDDIAEIAAMAITTWGFTKNSETGATAMDVSNWYMDKEFRENFPITDKHVEIGKAAIESFANTENDSEFNYLLKTLIGKKYVEAKWFPHIAGAVFGYTLKVARDAERKTYTKGYVGEIKKRMTFELTLESVRAVESYYGTTYAHNFVDVTGHKVVWFASNGDIRDNEDVKEGVMFSAKATPKKHEIAKFDGNHVTYINRLKVEA